MSDIAARTNLALSPAGSVPLDDQTASLFQQLLDQYASQSPSSGGRQLNQNTSEDQPSVVMVDLNMPGAKGSDLVASIRSARHAVSVLIVRGTEPARSSVASMIQDLPALMTIAQSQHHHERLRQWVNAVAPIREPSPLEKRAVLSSRNAIQSFIDRFHGSFLNAKSVCKNAHLTGKNVAATVGKWDKEGKVFRLKYGGEFVYPGFQFDDSGMPYPILKSILAELRKVPDRNEWGIAVWFGANNGWLGSKTPVECLASKAEQVLKAAEQDALHHEH